MKKGPACCCALLALAVAFIVPRDAVRAEAGHWGYTGEFGPSAWDRADPSFALCKSGKNQSPIDIVPAYAASLPALVFDYPHAGKTIVNNGHTVQVQFPRGNTLTTDGGVFELVQVHFHTPGENLYEGKAFPMEGHFVHQDRKGNQAVLAVFFEEGPGNPGIAALWAEMPRTAGEMKRLTREFNALSLLPDNRDYVYFNGSLTTPPCSEGVRWYVLKQPLSVDKEQAAAFRKVMGHPNNRPLQNVNARPVLRQSGAR
ncbi:MAG: carbonic anhydrase family protein [Desulfovibrio sp.]|jgi:carbonic anhydrase|nr:carbonic anhydrase family protein [Desulfovibrio sp.]